LSVDELRRLLIEKRRKLRQQKLEHFRRTGRVVSLASDLAAPSLDEMRVGAVAEDLERPEKRTPGRRVLDGFLLAVEILAVLGLVYIFYSVFDLLRTTNQEFAQELKQPTLTPTPLIVAVVLPSGHTPPNSPGGAQPNEAEIPDHLRPLVQSLASVPVPTAAPEQAIRIRIPALDIDAPIVQGDGWEQLKKGVAQHIGSANPGEKSNVVLSAHNDVFGEIFRYLDRLKPGDEVILYTNQRAYTYIVTETQIVEPTRVEVMAPGSKAIVTLISCYPYMVDNKRIVVVAQLQSGSH
jgi:sortase A